METSSKYHFFISQVFNNPKLPKRWALPDILFGENKMSKPYFKTSRLGPGLQCAFHAPSGFGNERGKVTEGQ